jgi:hypothetical protein
MGRSFTSVRQDLRTVAERWERTAQHSEEDTRIPGEMLAGWVKHHSSEAFFGCNGPAEAALFSVLVELHRQRSRQCNAPGGDKGAGKAGGDDDVDP